MENSGHQGISTVIMGLYRPCFGIEIYAERALFKQPHPMGVRQIW